MKRLSLAGSSCGLTCILLGLLSVATAQQPPAATAAPQATTAPATPKQEYPPYQEVIKDHEKVISTMDGKASMWTVWIRRKDNHLLAELPPDYAMKKYFIALTVASGEYFAGLQAGELYVYWKAYDKRLALIEPNISTRSTGDPESQSSVKRLFTDRVILDVPIATMSPMGGPVIDLGALLVGQAGRFFGGVQISNPALATIKTAKAFPQNIEIAFEAPMGGGGGRSRSMFGDFGGGGGRLKTLHYSISVIPDSTGYQTRLADQRVGYFTTSYNDLGRFKEDDTWVRYINRWKLEKADSSLRLSPPKNPITFYIEHTTPKRYRHWVKQGLLYWNKAFEKVGIRDAIEVYQQDASTGEHMEKDPEDVRYNFIRWLSNDAGTAIGPSRVHPLTGEILDADIILTDGWIRHFVKQHKEVLPSLAMEGFSPETLAWLDSHPSWDPRIRLAAPAERERLLAERAARGPQPFGGHPLAMVDPTMIGSNEYDGLVGRTSQVNGLCMAAQAKALDLGLLRMTLEVTDQAQEEEKDKKKKKEAKKEVNKDEPKPEEPKKDEAKKDEPKKEEPKKEEPKQDLLDGIPEDFIGPLIADLVAHEVGHTLGLRHNFKASSIYSLADINSEKVKGKAFAGSVMDYLPINFRMDEGTLQGDYGMVEIGPYDMWAIEYGYAADKDLKQILERVASPELLYGTDEDTWGPDPRCRRYDFSANPLDYAQNQMRLAKFHRERLIDKFVKEGDSWAKARRGYEMTLMLQVRSLSMMAGWVGGAFVNRDKKGDKNARLPLEVVPAKTQRDALGFVIENSFRPESFGLTPQLIQHLGVDQWLDEGGMIRFGADEPDWPIHDRIMSIQASVLTMLMNPTTLRRVYDNEFRTPSDQDMLTLPELLDTITGSIWTELDKKPAERCTARKPWVSSLRRNLQREQLERLIDLTLPDAGFTAAYKPIANLAVMKLREIKEKIGKALDEKAMLDPYTVAHLSEAQVRIDKALDAQYIYNVHSLGGGRGPSIIFLKEPNAPPQSN